MVPPKGVTWVLLTQKWPAQGSDSVDGASEGCHLGVFDPEMAHIVKCGYDAPKIKQEICMELKGRLHKIIGA